MGTILKDCFIEVDSVDVSDLVASVEVNQSAPEEDGSTFGGGRSRLHGLRDDSFVVTFLDDVDQAVRTQLQPLLEDEDTFTVTVRKHSGAASATNLEYTGTCKFFGFTWGGAIGSRDEIAGVTFPVEGQIATDDGSV